MPESQPTLDDESKPDDKNKNLPTAAPDAASTALEQAAEYGSIFESTVLMLDDNTKIKIPPHPSLRLLDDDVLEALDALEFDIDENCERLPDIHIAEEESEDRAGNKITIPARTVRGALKLPYRKVGEDGKAVLLSPPFDVQQVKLAIGEAAYAKLRAGTINGERGSTRHVKDAWRNQGQKVEERQAADSKSVGSAVDSQAVPPSDTP